MIPRSFVYERPDTGTSGNPNESVTQYQLKSLAKLKDYPIEFSSDIFDLLGLQGREDMFPMNDPTSPPPGVGSPVMNSYYNNPFYNNSIINNINIINGSSSPEIFIPSEAMNPTTTAGCAALAKIEAGSNDIDYWVLAFDTTTAESAFFTIRMPDDWDAGTLTFVFVWTNAAGLITETVAWGIKGRAYADSAAIDQSYGSEITTTDTWLAQGDIHLTAESTAVTPAGSLAAGQWAQFKITRKTGSDNMTGDALLIGVRLKYARA